MKAGIALIKQARQDKDHSHICDGMSLCLESNEAKDKIGRTTHAKFQQLSLPFDRPKHPNFISDEEASILSLLGAKPDWQSEWAVIASSDGEKKTLDARAWRRFHRFMYLSADSEFVHADVLVDAYYFSSFLTWTDPAKVGRYSLETMRECRRRFLQEAEIVKAWTEALTTIKTSYPNKTLSNGYGQIKTLTDTTTTFPPGLVKLTVSYLFLP